MIKSLKQKQPKQTMESIALEDLAIYKFEPNNILMVHRTTKDIYQYFQRPKIAFKQKTVVHDHLLQAQFLPTGIIYKKGITTMQNEISKRMKASVKQYYEEQELTNTFLPVLFCLQYLHSKDIVHGSICPENIVFNKEGDVLLRDWFLQIIDNKYYEKINFKERTKNDDISALGKIIYQASNLTQFKEQTENNLNSDNLLKKLVSKYSRGYILGIYIMINKKQKFYPHLQKIFLNDETFIENFDQLISMYKKVKGQKQLKPMMSPILNYNNFKNLDLMMKTPLTAKKVSKIEDVENKRTYQDIKKKNIDRINRIIQKNSNNQIAKRVDMVLKKMSNMKISNLQENDRTLKKIVPKQDVLKFSSPLKRLKTFSKKKAF